MDESSTTDIVVTAIAIAIIIVTEAVIRDTIATIVTIVINSSIDFDM